MSNLEGKVALVTGGGSGIGRGVSERLAREGADICIADIDLEGAEETAALVRDAGRKALVVQANVASLEQLDKAVSACVSGLGRLDVAVANAGIGRGGSVLDMPLKDWQDQLDINLTGVFLTVQACARRMVELGNGGRIVCISSLAAELVGERSWSYSATKAGVRIMVRGWAQELGAHGITVNAIGPGVIDTPLAAMLAGEEGGAIRTGLEERTPAGRAGKPGDIAGLVAFMAGPDGEFMTGSYVIMDGGLRDASGRRAPSADDPRMQEMQKLMAQGEARRAKLQALIDER
ncbi:MAG: SDR family oxidoreductase [Deltaproteobacteria bacterium]|nr:SDR family oxidoreductase [Deltaproteobacteria bacterium]MBW2414540.1 SDR family oxidoreductase [Deltaproteobacteria bacterium]